MRIKIIWGICLRGASIFNYEDAAKIKATPPSCNEKNPLKIRLLFGGKMWYVFIYQTRAHAQKKSTKKHNIHFIFTVGIWPFFLPFVHIFLLKNQVHMLKKHVHIWWKKSWSWLSFSPYVHDFVMLLFQQISEKIRLKKKCTCEKKTQIPILKTMNIFWRIGADLFNQKKPQFSPKKNWILGVSFLLGRGRGGWIVHYTRRDFSRCSAVFLPFAESS